MKDSAFNRISSVFEEFSTTGGMTREKDKVTFSWVAGSGVIYRLTVTPTDSVLEDFRAREFRSLGSLTVEQLRDLICRNL